MQIVCYKKKNAMKQQKYIHNVIEILKRHVLNL